MPTTEEFKQQRDQIMSLIMARFGSQNQELQQELEKLADTTALADDLEGLNRHQKFKLLNMMYTRMGNIFGTKKIRTYLLIFLMGAVITLIPTLLYVNTLKESDIPPFQFVPNAMGYKRPTFVKIIEKQEDIDKVKKSHIRDKDLASINAVIKLGKIGLSLIPANEMASPGYHIRIISSDYSKERNIDGFDFVPDGIFTKDPISMEVLYTDAEVQSAEKYMGLHNKDLLKIGSSVVCPKGASCFVTAKSTLDNEYSKIVPLSEL